MRRMRHQVADHNIYRWAGHAPVRGRPVGRVGPRHGPRPDDLRNPLPDRSRRVGDLDVILERLCRVARTGRPVALLFDYDGTLAPVRPTPAEADAYPRPPAAGSSGSPPADRVDGRGGERPGPGGRPRDGRTGRGLLRRDERAGTRPARPPSHPARAGPGPGPLDQLAGRLDAVAGRYLGAWLEQKPFGLTLHYRAVEPAQVVGLRRAAAEAMRPWVGQVRDGGRDARDRGGARRRLGQGDGGPRDPRGRRRTTRSRSTPGTRRTTSRRCGRSRRPAA